MNKDKKLNKMIIEIVLLGLTFASIVILYGVYLLMRNDKVCEFRQKVIKLCHERNLVEIYNLSPNRINCWQLFYNKLPSYESMLHSFKPLKLETYFTEEEIRELTKI